MRWHHRDQDVAPHEQPLREGRARRPDAPAEPAGTPRYQDDATLAEHRAEEPDEVAGADATEEGYDGTRHVLGEWAAGQALESRLEGHGEVEPEGVAAAERGRQRAVRARARPLPAG